MTARTSSRTTVTRRPARRRARLSRRTRETSVAASIGLDGRGRVSASTGIGFFDHMLSALAMHAGFDLAIEASGDLHVDQHHLVEDCGIVIGQAVAEALGDRRGIERTGFFAFPMEDAIALAALDLSGRPALRWRVRFRRARVGELDTDLIPEFFRGLARGLGADLHVVVPYRANDHHAAEAVFKAVGKALKLAVARDGRYRDLVPSTKGLLEGWR
ncbi:MAG: imidazoleglycerol-phosphate dehydratase [Acidobacteria bacterium]|jgi:imidazoleglycerol-phosphate dehydratase|nr:imidazoleglycerol-phosphate dehydratase [Acidobacteriota bacterium]